MSELEKIVAIREWLMQKLADNEKELLAYDDGFKYAVRVSSYGTKSVSHFTNEVAAGELAEQYNGENGIAYIYTDNTNIRRVPAGNGIFITMHVDEVDRYNTPDDAVNIDKVNIDCMIDDNSQERVKAILYNNPNSKP